MLFCKLSGKNRCRELQSGGKKVGISDFIFSVQIGEKHDLLLDYSTYIDVALLRSQSNVVYY